MTSPFRSATLLLSLLATASVLAACSPSSPDASASPSASPTPPVSASPSITPSPSATEPAALGWPREGWTQQPEHYGTLTAYFPDSWVFDNEWGYWTDGVYRTFCDAYVDPTLLDPGAPDAETLATTQWDLTFGPGAAANQHGFTTYFGADGWGGDVTLGDGVTVEPRAFLIIGDVWVHCGAITRDTAATGEELWDIVDSLEVVDKSGIADGAWNAGP